MILKLGPFQAVSPALVDALRKRQGMCREGEHGGRAGGILLGKGERQEIVAVLELVPFLQRLGEAGGWAGAAGGWGGCWDGGMLTLGLHPQRWGCVPSTP